MIYLTKKYAQQVAYIELSRPQKKNALNKELIEQLIDYLEKTAGSNQFRVLVISGKDRFFSAGADLTWMQEAKGQSHDQNMADANLFNKLYETLYNYPKPVIASVEGGAFGGAIGLMACADIVTTVPQAQFAFSETRLGLIPATVAPWVIKKSGTAFARYAMLTGLKFSAEDARLNGLVQYIISQEQIQPRTREIANHIAKNSPEATKETKKLLNRIDHQIVKIDEELLRYCSTKIADARISDEGQEGVNAFFAQRKPSWNR